MFEHTNRMRFVKISNVTTDIMSENILYKRDDSGCPDSPISLEAHHIRKKYKTLKRDMNTEIVDYLVQSNILTTDENSSLLHKSRAEKCDFILRRLILDPNCLTKLVTLLHEEPKDLDEFDCFRSLLSNTSPEPEIPNSDNHENDSTVLVHNLKLDENRKRLLNLFKRHINNKSSNSILDDFLQEDLITIEEHEEISVQSERSRTEAAELLYAAVERSRSLTLLSILKSYDAGGLADRLQLHVEGLEIDVETDLEASFTVRIRDGKVYLFSADEKTKVQVKIISADENRLNLTCLMEVIPKAEETLAQKTHCSIERTSEGSIIILLQTETDDAVEKLRQFIESGEISKFLKQLFDTSDVRKLLEKDKYTIEIEIKKVQSSVTDFPANELQGTETPEFKYRSILERCHRFLLEELEPGYFLRDEEVAAIFTSVRADVKEQTNRTAKNELLLEHLKKQPEEDIQFVLEKLENRNAYIYRQLFPNTGKFQDIDIEQVKRNILDNLPELLDEINIETLQTPFLSTGVLTREELDALRCSSESLRTENLQFVKLVLHRGAEIIRVFLGSLENSRGESELCRRLTKQTDTEDTSEGKNRNTKIKYEAFDDENGLLFTGNFLIELLKDTNESPEQECLSVKKGDRNQDSVISDRSQSEDSTSSESDSQPVFTPTPLAPKDSPSEALESEISNLLSKLTIRLMKVEYVKDIKDILSRRHVRKTLQMEEVRQTFPHNFRAIEKDVSKLRRCLRELQYLSDGVKGEVQSSEEELIDDVIPEADQEPEMKTLAKPVHYLARQVSVLSFESTDESTMDSGDDEEQENISDLGSKSSKYQSILMVKLHNLETVRSVMRVLSHKAERENQLMAIKNILNEEEYKRLEKYIIKLQRVSEKILERSTGKCA
ncbi:uncharacterized protein LOC111100011 isoform X1 [Crassostrea virginica]